MRRIGLGAIALSGLLTVGSANSASFASGNVVVLRVGNGASLVNTGSPIFLDEYTPAGSLVQSIALPTTVSGGNKQCILSGTSTSEGMIRLSEDGNYISGTCYARDLGGVGSLTSSTSASVNRTVFRAAMDGSIDTTTALTDASDGSSPRSAVTTNGTNFWMAGGSGSVRAFNFGATTSTQISTTLTNLRVLDIFNAQLFTSTSSGTAIRIGTVGTGLPTTSGQTITALTGITNINTPSPYSYFFADLDNTVAGVDTLYIADDTGATGGILKYSLVASTWTANNTVGAGTDAYRGLAGKVVGSTVTLFATRKGGSAATGGGELVSLTDTSGYNAANNGTIALLASNATNTAMRGVVLIPTVNTTPALSVVDTSEAEGQLACGVSDQRILNVTINSSLAAPVGGMSVNFATSDNTTSASEGNSKQDYLPVSITVNFLAGETSKQVPITIVCDDRAAPDETINITLTNPVNATIADGSGVVTLTNDDGALGSFGHNATPTSATEGNSGTQVMSFQFDIPSSRENVISFNMQFNDGTATTADNDYLATSGLATVPYSTGGAGAIILAVGDTNVEPDESMSAVIQNLLGAPAGTLSKIGTILTDDFAVVPSISINDVGITEGDSGSSNLVFTASISPAPVGSVSVDFVAAANTATSPSDFSPTTGTVNFTNAVTTATISIPVIGDCTIESSPSSETFFVNLSNATGGATISDAQGIGTISDNDVAINAVISVTPSSANEGNSGTNTRNYSVTLTPAMQCGDFNFNINTTGSSATTETDFGSLSLTSGSITQGNSLATGSFDVNGDTNFEANETVLLNLTGTGTNLSIGTNPATATIVNDDAAITPIHTIQGSGNASPLVATSVTTTGIVTARVSNGFFMQEPDATVDADPSTSEGIFIFTSAAPPATAAVGNSVQVVGTVFEFVPNADPVQPPLTQLTSPTVTLLTAGNPLPAPFVLTTSFPSTSGDIQQMERLEAMRVSIPSLTVVAPTLGAVIEPSSTATSSGVFQGVVTGVARPFRETGIEAPEVPPTGSIPPIPRFDGNPERIRVDSDRQTGTTAFNVSTGTVLTGLVGVFDYSFRTFTLAPDPGITIGQSGGITPAPASAPAATDITLASYNLNRFFDNVDDPAITDPILTTTALNNRLAKASDHIRNFLNAPDILGVVEVENLSVLQTLANKINADALAAGQSNPNYVAQLIEGNDIGGIDIGFLIKTAIVFGTTPRVTINAVAQENATETFANPDLSTSILNDRPPLRLNANVNAANTASYALTFIVVHQRSLGSISSAAVETNGWASAGERVRAKRQKQAESLANLIQTRQTNNASENIIVMGDFNGFEFNDGYADVMNIVTGTPSADNATVVPGDGIDLVNPNLVNLGNLISGDYGYSFGGNAQSIDHALVNAALVNSVTSIDIEEPHINADYPETNRNINTPGATRLSDHDPVVVTITVPGFGLPDALFANGFE